MPRCTSVRDQSDILQHPAWPFGQWRIIARPSSNPPTASLAEMGDVRLQDPCCAGFFPATALSSDLWTVHRSVVIPAIPATHPVQGHIAG